MTDTPVEVAEAMEILDGVQHHSDFVACNEALATIRAHISELERQLAEAQSVALTAAGQAQDYQLRLRYAEAQLAAQRERDGRDAERLDFIAPGFRMLAGDHVAQIWWVVTLPDGKKESRVVSVPVDTPDRVRALIDAALKDRP